MPGKWYETKSIELLYILSHSILFSFFDYSNNYVNQGILLFKTLMGVVWCLLELDLIHLMSSLMQSSMFRP